MAWCSSCGSEVPSLARFCAACGATLSSDDVDTLIPDATARHSNTRNTDDVDTMISSEPAAAPPPSRGSSASKSGRPMPKPVSMSASSSAFLHGGRFLPGSLLAERYRIVALLGKGGMGEVYRADDLTLGQPVALKFLPEEAARDAALVERFRGEVRISRKVSHPNVCRVYDVGEVDGQTYFTMEYVDGEDLASLLRRIGRLPNDKALDIARQLCAGLAAAHVKGVLHRDLKPANIMLDGRGQAVITDFGLAALTNQLEGAEVRSGTPAYMSPEQLAGTEVSEKSDIYSLGLVLYEIFTGKKAFSAGNLAELVRTRSEGAVSRPSTVIKDIDPLVERVILLCLEADPARRPATALSVAAALPGGDPLAAALAAGETPSPQMVAAAGETEGMQPKRALLCLAACVVGLVACVALIPRTDGLLSIPLEMSPDVLTHKARQIVSQLGYDPKPVDSATDFLYNADLQKWIEENDKPKSPSEWSKILAEQPAMLQFTYRQSSRYMMPLDMRRSMTPAVMDFGDPPTTQSGMINLIVDTNGRLTFLQALPPEFEESPPAAKPMDWKPLFAAAGLDPSQFQNTSPQWTSLANSDERAAWTGKWPGSGRPLRVEAGAWHGKAVFFLMTGPWTRPSRMRPFEETRGRKIRQLVDLILFFGGLLGASLLARRQYKQGKGDRASAFRLTVIVFLAQMAIWLCFGHFIPDFDTFGAFLLAVGTSLLMAGMTWILYMALEPYVRKLWPHCIISWTRLMSGRVRDPLVGRDVMFGVILGLTWTLIFELTLDFGARHFGTAPQLLSTDYLLGLRSTLGTILERVPDGIRSTLFFFFILVGLRYLLRNQWAAAAGFVAIFTTLSLLASQHVAAELPMRLLIYAIAAFALVRFGLITLAVAVVVANTLLNVPVTLDFSRWYAGAAMSVPILFLALTVWGFYAALGGRKVFEGAGPE